MEWPSSPPLPQNSRTEQHDVGWEAAFAVLLEEISVHCREICHLTESQIRHVLQGICDEITTSVSHESKTFTDEECFIAKAERLEAIGHLVGEDFRISIQKYLPEITEEDTQQARRHKILLEALTNRANDIMQQLRKRCVSSDLLSDELIFDFFRILSEDNDEDGAQTIIWGLAKLAPEEKLRDKIIQMKTWLTIPEGELAEHVISTIEKSQRNVHPFSAEYWDEVNRLPHKKN